MLGMAHACSAGLVAYDALPALRHCGGCLPEELPAALAAASLQCVAAGCAQPCRGRNLLSCLGTCCSQRGSR